MNTAEFNALRTSTQGQEKMITLMDGQDRMAWLAGLPCSARHQVTYAINSFSHEEREEYLGGGGCIY